MSVLRPISRSLRFVLPKSIFNAVVELYYSFCRVGRKVFLIRPRMINTGGRPIRHFPDGLWTYAGNSFDNDPRFHAAWSRIHEHVGNIRAIDWRLHIVFALADYCSNLDGDFVECGTYTGINAHGLIAYLGFGALDKDMYLLDTWTGLSEQALFDFEKDRAIRCYEDCFQEVKETFADTPNVHLIQGLIPDTLEDVEWGPIAFLHLDMNCTFPEKAALEFFWEKIVAGGVVISDDYGHPGYEEQKQMYEDFATSKGLTVLSLPTGTGVLFKP